MGKNDNSGLGRSLARRRGGGGRLSGRQQRRNRASGRHSDGNALGDLNATDGSVLHVSDLTQILIDAELTGRTFTAERRSGAVLVNSGAAQPPPPPVEAAASHHVEAQRARVASARSAAARRLLRLPRRPPWSKDMTPEELQLAERRGFLEWRGALAKVEDSMRAVITPFEKNLDMWRQLWRVIERSDVIVQIVDARDPLLFWCEDLFDYAAEVSEQESLRANSPQAKRMMLLLNKADLLSRDLRVRWARCFHRRGIEAYFFSALAGSASDAEQDAAGHSQQTSPVHDDDATPAGDAVAGGAEEEAEEDAGEAAGALLSGGDGRDGGKEDEDDGSMEEGDGELLTTHELVHLFASMRSEAKRNAPVDRNAPSNSRVVIGMVGYPNVGKSSTINLILGRKKVSVSATPGRTKHFQTLVVDDEVMLCDCPGLVMPNFAASTAALVCRGVLPIDQLRDARPAVGYVCENVHRRELERRYSINLAPPAPSSLPETLEEKPSLKDHVSAEELLDAYGRSRGFMSGHGTPDQHRAARYILKDFVNGRLVYAAEPPE